MIPRGHATLVLLLALVPASPPVQAEDDLVSLLRSGDYAGVVDRVGGLTGDGAADAAVQVLLGRALEAQGAMVAAREAFERAAEAGRLDARVAAARLAGLAGDAGEAREAREAVLERAREAEALPPVQRIAAGDAAVALARATPSLYREALALYEAALVDAREADDVDGMVSAQVALGELLLHRFNNEEALEAFRAALERAPADPAARLGLARSMHFDGASGAEEAVREVLAINAAHADALSLLATLQIEREDYTAAAETVATGLAVNPMHPPLRTRAAALAFLTGDEDGFLTAVETLRSDLPGYVTLYETLAELAAQVRRYARAAEFAEEAVRLDPRAWRGHALLGTNRLRIGQMWQGRRSLETAFGGDPFDPYVKNSLELLDRLDGYRQVRSERFVLVAEPDEATILGELLLPIAEEAYDAFAARYDYRPETPIRIEIYPRHEDFSVRTVGMVGIDIVGVSFGPVVAMDSPSAGVFGPLNFGSVLWHELAHTFHLGMTDARVPRWFSEGLSVYEERRGRTGWGNDASIAFVTAYARGELPRPSELNQTFLRPSTPEALLHGYYQASLLMELIAERHGFEAIVRMLESYGRGASTPQAIRESLGQSPWALDIAFDTFMQGRFGGWIDALGLDGNGVDTEASGPYPALMSKAREALEDGDHAQAREHLLEAQALLPGLAGGEGAHLALARVHEALDDVPAAIAALRANIDIDADDVEAHRELARLELERGRSDAAAPVLARALLIDPFDLDAHRTLAEIHESLEDWALAIEARRAVLHLDDADAAGNRFHLARAHLRSGDPEQAREHVLQALEEAPLYGDALELLLEIRERGGAR